MTATPYTALTTQALSEKIADLEQRFNELRGNNLKLDLTRGKPAADQLALSDALDGVLAGDYASRDGTDTRNYGGLRGVIEARELGARLLGVPIDTVLAGGNSSLQLMSSVTRYLIEQRWGGTSPTMLCPVPGYDRHFTLCESFGLPMIGVPITDQGPPMEQVERLVAENDDIAGIWCVPRFSNPTGCVYSADTVKRLAALPHKASHPDFIVFWDNAYAVHSLSDDAPELTSLAEAARSAGTADQIVQFASTSKITFAGAGVAFCAASEHTLAGLARHLSSSTIGPDKVNQLRTARFLEGRLSEHMASHAALLRPKFTAVLGTLERTLAGLDIATWTTPAGGYFISLDTRPGLAAQVIRLAGQAGVTLTPAGATFPYGNDPQDCNIRIAPTFANLDDVQIAIEVLAVAVQLASARQIQQQQQAGQQ